jgi:Spy/CpxP family protein refolding chaperone
MSLTGLFRRPGARVAALLAAVFLAGMAAGAALDRLAVRRAPRFPLMERAVAADLSPLVASLQRGLDLTDEQVPQVRAILERRQPQYRAAWNTARTSILAQLDSTVAELSVILTPEQRQKLANRLQGRGVVRARDSLLRREP